MMTGAAKSGRMIAVYQRPCSAMMIASALLLPTLIVGFYGQNFLHSFNDFYWSIGVSVGLIVASTIAQLAVFRWRHWI